MVCKLFFLLLFPDIPKKAGRKTRRKRTQAISKCYTLKKGIKRNKKEYQLVAISHKEV